MIENTPPPTAGKKRKFRFRLRSLFVLCFLAAIGTCSYKWIQWPKQTLLEFDRLVKEERFEEAARRIDCEPNYIVTPQSLRSRVHVTLAVCRQHATPTSRSFADLVSGRQTYALKGDTTVFVDTGDVRARFLIDKMTLERGRIRYSLREPYTQGLRFENGKWTRDETFMRFGVVPR